MPGAIRISNPLHRRGAGPEAHPATGSPPPARAAKEDYGRHRVAADLESASRGADLAPRHARHEQPGDRRSPIHQSKHGRVPPRQGVPQAQRQVTHTACTSYVVVGEEGPPVHRVARPSQPSSSHPCLGIEVGTGSAESVGHSCILGSCVGSAYMRGQPRSIAWGRSS